MLLIGHVTRCLVRLYIMYTSVMYSDHPEVCLDGVLCEAGYAYISERRPTEPTVLKVCLLSHVPFAVDFVTLSCLVAVCLIVVIP